MSRTGTTSTGTISTGAISTGTISTGAISTVLSRPVSVTIASLGLVVLGLFSLNRLPVSLLPTLERPRLLIHAQDAERSRDELLTQVVLPLERRLLAMAGVLDVKVEIDDGEARFTLETEWQTDIDRLRIDVERRLSGEAISGLEALSVEIDAGDERPILQVAVTGGQPARRTAFAEKVLLPELARVPGAGQLRLTGGADRRPVVTPRVATLAAHGLVAADIASRLEVVGREQPLGRIRSGGTVRPLFLRHEVRDVAELGDVRIGQAGLRLREVADIELRTVPRSGVARVNGQDAVLVEVYRAPGRNAVKLAREARDAAARLSKRASPLAVEVVGDSSQEVVSSLRQLAEAGLIGLVLGTLVLRFLLGSWRPTLALVVVVPVSIIAAFSAFLAAGISLDLVSLAGLALAAGMLVDNSIVVLEAIQGARERRAEDPILEGSRQIAMALVASFATTAVVFLPLIYLRGLARAFFGVQAFAIVSTLLISLALSLSLTPVLARRFGAHRAAAGRQPGRGAYLKMLGGALERPRALLILTLAALLAVAVMAQQIPRELVPQGVTQTLVAEARLPPSIAPEEAAKRLATLSALLAPHLEGTPSTLILPERKQAATYRRFEGPAELSEIAELDMRFATPAQLEQALPGLIEAASAIPGLDLSFSRRPSAIAAAIQRTARALEIRVSTSTAQRLAAAEDEVRNHLLSGDWRPVTDFERVRPAWWLRFDEARLIRLQAEAAPLVAQLRQGSIPRSAGRADIAGVEPDIYFETNATFNPLEAPPAIRAAGRVLPLDAVAQISAGGRQDILERRAGRPSAVIAVDGGLAEAAALEKHLASLVGAADLDVRLAGLTEELRRSFTQLRLALGLALVLVFLTVAALYESLRLPLVVMVTVPTASAGAFLALMATGESFNVMSFLGLIVLTGIVVNNAIVLLHRAEQHRFSGQKVATAVQLAAAERYRPILMTTLTTFLGMVPLALLGGDGLELRRSLAVTVAGGLMTSWAASLIVVPVLYRLLLGDDEVRPQSA